MGFFAFLIFNMEVSSSLWIFGGYAVHLHLFLSLFRTPWFTLSACVVPTPWYPSHFCNFVFVSSVTKCVSHNVLRSGSLWDLSVPVFLISHFIFDPYEVTATCWIGLLSAPWTYSACACTCWSVPAPLFASTDLASNRLALLLSHGQGRELALSPLSSGPQWAEIALSWRCPSLALPIHSAFSWLSVSLIILVKIILYLSWSCRFIQKELISSFHSEIFEF